MAQIAFAHAVSPRHLYKASAQAGLNIEQNDH
jgi:hypothetical protein